LTEIGKSRRRSEIKELNQKDDKVWRYLKGDSRSEYMTLFLREQSFCRFKRKRLNNNKINFI